MSNRDWSVRPFCRYQTFSGLLIGVVLLGLSCTAHAQEVVSSEKEKAALLEVRLVQAEAVVAFNEALMTAQAARRARGHLQVAR